MIDQAHLSTLHRRVLALTVIQGLRGLVYPVVFAIAIVAPDFVPEGEAWMNGLEFGLAFFGFVALLFVLRTASIVAEPWRDETRNVTPVEVTISFFIPIVNFYRPYLMVKAIDASLATGAGEKRSRFILVWWLLWIAHGILLRLVGSSDSASDLWAVGAAFATIPLVLSNIAIGWILLGRARRIEAAAVRPLDGEAVADVFR